MKTLPVKKEFNYETRDKTESNFFTIAFVYPKDETPYIVKGDQKRVEEYLKNTKSVTFIRIFVNWKNYIGRGKHNFQSIRVFGCKKDHWVIFSKNYQKAKTGSKIFQRGFSFECFFPDNKRTKHVVRQIPRCFPKEIASCFE